MLKVSLRDDIARPYLIFDVLDGRGLQLTGRRIALPAGAGLVTVRIALEASFQQGVYRLRTRVVDAPKLESVSYTHLDVYKRQRVAGVTRSPCKTERAAMGCLFFF